MTEAMPFLQKTILLSYDPRPLPRALVLRLDYRRLKNALRPRYWAESPRRRKVRLTSFPPGGENCVRSLAPPLPAEPTAAGLRRGPHQELGDRKNARGLTRVLIRK